jgi:hypothetical protein
MHLVSLTSSAPPPSSSLRQQANSRVARQPAHSAFASKSPRQRRSFLPEAEPVAAVRRVTVQQRFSSLETRSKHVAHCVERGRDTALRIQLGASRSTHEPSGDRCFLQLREARRADGSSIEAYRAPDEDGIRAELRAAAPRAAGCPSGVAHWRELVELRLANGPERQVRPCRRFCASGSSGFRCSATPSTHRVAATPLGIATASEFERSAPTDEANSPLPSASAQTRSTRKASGRAS